MTKNWSQSRGKWIRSSMGTGTCPINWKRQNKLLGKLKTYNKNMLNSISSIGKPMIIWSVSKLIWNKWCGTTQKWKSPIVTIKYHNQFGTNLSRPQRATSSCPHRVWKGKTKSNCANLGLERLVWYSQGIIE